MGEEVLPGPAIRTPHRGIVLGIWTLVYTVLLDLGEERQITSLPQLFLFFIGISPGVHLYPVWSDGPTLHISSPRTCRLSPELAHCLFSVHHGKGEEDCCRSWCTVITVNTTLHLGLNRAAKARLWGSSLATMNLAKHPDFCVLYSASCAKPPPQVHWGTSR